MAGMMVKMKRWFHRSEVVAKEEAEGGLPVATPVAGSSGDPDRETSTNAQTAAASDEPWSDND
jgi:hypothetical protein